MTLEIPHRVAQRRARSRASGAPPATQAPTEPPAATGAVAWARMDVDRYEVTVDAATVGFVEVVGAVFVALSGPRYDRAVEVAQTLVFESAVAVLCGADRSG